MATGTSKGGYDYEFVTPPPKFLECSVCLLTLRDPHVTSCCGNEFCQACIKRVQRDGKPCPLCNEPSFTTFLHKKLVREVNALVVHCPQKELGCDWEGELGQVRKHLEGGESTSKGCGYVLVACSYGCGVELPRHQLAIHELEVCPKQPIIERQMASFMRKFDAVVGDNQLLRQELQVVRQHHQSEIREMKGSLEDQLKVLEESHQEELKVMKEEMYEMKKTIRELKAHDFKLMEKDKELKREVDKEISAIKQTCASLEINTVHLVTPPFYFAIQNIEHLKNTYQTWVSDAFYSHPGGYKMTIWVYPSGCYNGTGTHLSVSVRLVRGEFDDQLQWPFNGEVTIEAFNRSKNQWSKRAVIKMDKDDAVCKPKKFCNAECGYDKYISHRELNHQYVYGMDSVSMRVVAVKLFRS